MRFTENKSRLIRILIAFVSSLFDDYNFCNVKFSPGLLMTYACQCKILNRLTNNSANEFRIDPDSYETMEMAF